MKILILVLSYHDNSIYTKFYHKQKETWDSEKVEGASTLYYFGNSNICKIEDDKILLDVSESIQNCGIKTLKAFDYIMDLDFDFIFRTNSSSYIDKRILLDFIKDKPNEKYCSAIIGNYKSINFPSGCGYFLSKDLVKLTLDRRSYWDHGLIDDVSLGKILGMSQVKINSSSRFDVTDIKNIPPDYFHYRLKSFNRNLDILAMEQIKKIKDEFYNRK